MRVLLSVTLALVMARCADNTPTAILTTEPPPAVVEPLFGSLYSNIREPRRLLIRDLDTWNALWGEIVGTTAERPEAPRVDFTREDVLVAAMGERRAAGYEIEITDVSMGAGQLSVTVVSFVPGPVCDRSEVISAPVDAVRIPKSTAPIVFRETTVVLTCQ